MSKAELAPDVSRSIKVSIADLEALCVDGVYLLAEVLVRRDVFQEDGKRRGKFPRRVVLSKDDVGNGVAALVASEESLQKSGAALDPWQLDGHSGLVHYDGIWAGRQDGFHECVCLSR